MDAGLYLVRVCIFVVGFSEKVGKPIISQFIPFP